MGLVWKHRQERKRQLLAYIAENTKEGEELEVSKLMALFSWRFEVKPDKIKEYLHELHELGAITGSKTVKPTRFATTLLEK